jgi:hypothetical protein
MKLYFAKLEDKYSIKDIYKSSAMPSNKSSNLLFPKINRNSPINKTTQNNMTTEMSYFPLKIDSSNKTYQNSSHSIINTSLKLPKNINIDTEISNLHSCYFDVHREKKRYTKDLKIQTFTRFKIKEDITDEEKTLIESKFKLNRNKSTMNTTKFNSTNMNNVSRTQILNYYEDYKSPVNSLVKLKRNKQIHDNLVNLMNHKQIETYQQKYEEANEITKKVSKMPLTRVISNSFQTKLKEKLLEANTNMNREEDLLAQDENENDKIKSSTSKTYKLLSKEDMLCNSDYYAYIGPFSTFLPSARCGATWTQTKDGSAYLIGGINNDRLMDFWIFDMKKLNWKPLQVRGELPMPRMGHSAVHYKNQIFIYGGNLDRDEMQPKEDIIIFSLFDNKIYLEKCYNKLSLKWRRNHIAQALNNQMIIHGGIDENNSILGDTFLLDLDTLRWHELHVKEDSHSKSFPVCNHSSVLVVLPERRSSHSNIFRFPETISSISSMKHEGIYMFGGLDKENNCNNILRILKFGKKPLEWVVPNTQGISPSPRYGCTINHYEELDVLFLFGGKDHRSKNLVYDDFFMLELSTLKWTNIKIFDNQPQPRFDHCSTILGSKLIIFGGSNTRTFIGSSLYIIELDFFENKKKKREYENLKRMGLKQEQPKQVKISTNEIVITKHEFENLKRRSSMAIRYTDLPDSNGLLVLDKEELRLHTKLSNNNLLKFNK